MKSKKHRAFPVLKTIFILIPFFLCFYGLIGLPKVFAQNDHKNCRNRFDLNCDGTVDLTDFYLLVSYLLAHGIVPPVSVEPTPTPTVMPTPTTTPAPVTPATPTPTAGVTPTPQGGFLPLCPTHDPAVWHPLIDTVRNCHYDHEHGDDPSLGNSVFGPAGDWWNGDTNANIGVPWKTSDLENTMKHPLAKYYVRISGGYQSFPGCGINAFTDNAGNGAENNCVKSVRLLAHGSGNPMESLTRNHSMAAEIILASKASNYTKEGILRLGSWLDYGKLVAPFYGSQYTRPGGTVTFPNNMTMNLTADTVDISGDLGGEPYWFMSLSDDGTRDYVARYENGAGDQFSSNEVGPYDLFDCAPFPTGTLCGDRHVHILINTYDSFALLNPADINKPDYICSGQNPTNCSYNSSRRGLGEIAVWINPAWDSLDGTVDGYVTYDGYTDRYQRMQPAGTCSGISTDCIPIQMKNVPVNYAATRFEPVTPEDKQVDYDTCRERGQWCISFPN